MSFSLIVKLDTILTSPKVDNEVYEEYRVGKAVEGYPPGA